MRPSSFRPRLATLPLPALLCLAIASCAPAQSHNANAIDDSVIGVVQCDEYLAKVSACIGRLPQQQRAALTTQARETFAIWKEAAANPQHRTTLPQACTVTQDLAREELAPLGCTF